MSFSSNFANEMDRIINLSEFDLDYLNHDDTFKDLARLAAKVAGTSSSQVNIIDFYSQWTISNYGSDNHHTPREDSVCQYTIVNGGHFEVEDLAADIRFKDKSYVAGDPHYRYYYGVPLQTKEGYKIGSLCVLDQDNKRLDKHQSETLKIIAGEIINHLNAFKMIAELKSKLADGKETHKKVAHDIRGPIGGIIGLSELVIEQGETNRMDEVLELVGLIRESGRSVLELADGILTARETAGPDADVLTLALFKNKLQTLFKPQALNKNVSLTVNASAGSLTAPFIKTKLLQIAGNLISNAIKFTPQGGSVTVDLRLMTEDPDAVLEITVRDTGVGLDDLSIASILQGGVDSTAGTNGEPGHGFGLRLVKHLVDGLNSWMDIRSTPGAGTVFHIRIAQSKNAGLAKQL